MCNGQITPLSQQFWIGIAANNFQGGLIDDASAAGANVKAMPVRVGVWLHFVAFVVAWIKPVGDGCVATKANPGLGVAMFMGNKFFGHVRKQLC